ncbi:MAG: MogA/MoaB family molybdenum cofactor biosynthesis protein [Pirellulales bacterium]
MSTAAEEHRDKAPVSVCCAVVTISDTRTVATDRGGALLIDLLQAAGHEVTSRAIVPDDAVAIAEQLAAMLANDEIQAVLLTGGTGISARDQTYETISQLLTKPLPGYGELFRLLSYQEIGAAAMLSRAIGGLAGRTVVLTMPGSTAAVRLAMEKLILPELGHLVFEARK